ncbi:23S rRNA (adenine(2030)-N(6))-methyltransferase RlmJ [Stappia indica]|uniref:23S rRNA (adenine(2030)-N(6))-methyltransferase RlmJ n=1 Tax=Stappia indica TaxID=538381 RepID=UPI001CD1B66A|nr:23S rRNA (adenine(2030)-N(6))-methyltransferase RlmJ [Stappia indica]MCA1300853.1 23S rRNA (adenine(2030)-N(6))-methyltransferase RlmJ [Stappia indica]
MNYRHAFHAGNIGDVLKHMVLALVIEYLKKKPGAFRVIDTHAGIGRYDLSGDEAQRTGEWRDGIGRVLAADIPEAVAAELAPWLETVLAVNSGAGDELRTYPGSPLLARMMLRAQDRLTATELHPQDHATLAALFAGDRQVKVIELDGWLALRGFLPPKERRGLVLIDPPFEATDEFDTLANGLIRGWKRWPTGVYLVWFPIKDRKTVNRFYNRLREAGIGRMLSAELFAGSPEPHGPMRGSGLLAINPPWTLAHSLECALPWLSQTLARGPDANWRLIPLAGE